MSIPGWLYTKMGYILLSGIYCCGVYNRVCIYQGGVYTCMGCILGDIYYGEIYTWMDFIPMWATYPGLGCKLGLTVYLNVGCVLGLG